MRILPTSLRDRLRTGLLMRFALAGLVAVVLLGVVLARTLSGEIRQRSLADGRQSAQLIDQSLIQPKLSAAALKSGLSPAQIAVLDRELQAVIAGKRVARIKVWNDTGRAVYASDHTIIGKRFPESDELKTALAGGTASEISDLRKAENANDRRAAAVAGTVPDGTVPSSWAECVLGRSSLRVRRAAERSHAARDLS